MRDQATDLRKLVLQSMRESSAKATPAPRLVAMSGAQDGVGVTTLAINLSIALAIQGARVVLVDADQQRLEVAVQLGLIEAQRPDLISSRVDIHEVLVRGPAGVLVLPGLWKPETAQSISGVVQHRLIHQLQKLGRHADLVLLDLGCGTAPIVNRFWEAADSVLLVTSADAVSVMNAYATIKRFHSPARTVPIHLVVNEVDSAEMADDVFCRVDQSCQKFLGLCVEFLGHLPAESRLTSTTVAPPPFLLRWPQSDFAKGIERLAATLNSYERQARARPPAA